MKTTLEHLVYTSIRDYAVQACSAGIRKECFGEIPKHCIYKPDRTLTLMNPANWKKLPVIFRFYSIPDGKEGDLFFVSRTFIGGADRSGRVVTLTHSVHLPDESLDSVSPTDLLDSIDWIKSYKGESQAILPPLEVEFTERGIEGARTADPDFFEQTAALFLTLMKALDEEKPLFVFPGDQDDYDLWFQSLRVIFMLLSSKALTFSLKEFYSPEAHYQIVLFDPQSSVEKAGAAKTTAVIFPLSERGETQARTNPAIEHFVSKIRECDIGTLAEIRKQMREIPEPTLNNHSFLIRFGFWKNILHPLREGRIATYPEAVPCWLEMADLLLSGPDHGSCRSFLLDHLDAMAPIPTSTLKPEDCLKLCAGWRNLLGSPYSEPFRDFIIDMLEKAVTDRRSKPELFVTEFNKLDGAVRKALLQRMIRDKSGWWRAASLPTNTPRDIGAFCKQTVRMFSDFAILPAEVSTGLWELVREMVSASEGAISRGVARETVLALYEIRKRTKNDPATGKRLLGEMYEWFSSDPRFENIFAAAVLQFNVLLWKKPDIIGRLLRHLSRESWEYLFQGLYDLYGKVDNPLANADPYNPFRTDPIAGFILGILAKGDEGLLKDFVLKIILRQNKALNPEAHQRFIFSLAMSRKGSVGCDVSGKEFGACLNSLRWVLNESGDVDSVSDPLVRTINSLPSEIRYEFYLCFRKIWDVLASDSSKERSVKRMQRIFRTLWEHAVIRWETTPQKELACFIFMATPEALREHCLTNLSKNFRFTKEELDRLFCLSLDFMQKHNPDFTPLMRKRLEDLFRKAFRYRPQGHVTLEQRRSL